MAQAGSEQSPLTARPSPSMSAFSHTSTPFDRSLTSSPSPAPTSSLHSSVSNESDSAENHRFLSADPPAKIQLIFSPLDLGGDRSSNFGNSPLSAHSTSSQSSFSTSFKPAASSGYTSGTSSTYSSLGRKPIDPKISSSIATAAGSTAGALQSPLTESSIQSFRRPSSALSVHSYPSSRADSPAQMKQDLQEDEEHDHGEQHPEESKQGEAEEDRNSEDGQLEETNLSRPLPQTPPRDRAVTPLFEPTRSPARFTVPYSEEEIHGIQRSGTSSSSLAGSTGRYSKSSSSNSLVDAADLVKKTSILAVSTAKPVATVTAPPPVERPTPGRVRSRSTVGVSSPGLVRARTEALLNQAQNHTSSPPPPARPTSHYYNSSPISPRTTAVSSAIQEDKRNSAKYDINAQESRESKAPPLEAEPNRSNSSIFRHGRQRSNTVGEAISLPNDDNILTEEDVIPSQRRASVVPDGHCHKCHERVTENGVMLQGGVKFHIGCFLCNGCKQVFTESQFHVVNGRPYHPAVSSSRREV